MVAGKVDDVGRTGTSLDALLVDDEDSAHAAVRRSLTDAHLRSAFNIHQARDAIEARTPDVLILDLNLPSGSGLRLLQDGAVSCPCVVLTAYASKESALEAYQLGVVDYVEKTVEGLASLAAVVHAAIQRHLRKPWWHTELHGLLQEMSTGVASPGRYESARRRFDSILVRVALEQSSHNKRAAARRLGITHQTLYRRLRQR